MKLIYFLLQCSRGIRHARAILLLVIICGALSGIINTALLAVINAALGRTNAATPGVIWSFVGFCAVLPVVRFISETLLVRLAANAIFDLRVSLCRRILAAPLRLLEEVG